MVTSCCGEEKSMEALILRYPRNTAENVRRLFAGKKQEFH